MEKDTNITPQKPNPATPVIPQTHENSTIDVKASLRWKEANLAEQKMLQNLQGNILKGHGRDSTWNVFFALDKNRVAESKRALREIGNSYITSAYAQLLGTELFKTMKTDAGTFCAAFLSKDGYEAIGEKFSIPDGNSAFNRSMKDTAGRDELNDPRLEEWEEAFRQRIDGMILVADDDIARGSSITLKIQTLLTKAGAEIIHTQQGKSIRNAIGNGLEHFGYVDGRSQPLMLLEDIDQESRDEGISHWDPAFPLDTVLVPDPLTRDANGHPDPTSFGSFFVFRKLEQDVAGFKLQEQMLADHLQLKNEEREQAGAYVVGRFEDGTPITIAGEPQNRKIPRNDFNYMADTNAGRCPFHAHIRKTNPRGGSDPDNANAERLHIMARRGITYEDAVRMIHPDGLPETDSTDEFNTKVLPHLPAKDVGLLFMAYNASLDRQFVFTQKLWANNINFPPPLLEGQNPPGIDPVIGMGTNVPDGQIYPNEWDDPGSGGKSFGFMGFVHMKGGEYFFAPSLKYLRNL